MSRRKTDQFGNPITTSNTQSTPATHSKRNVVKEFKMDDQEDEDEEEEDGEEEEDMELEEEEEKPKATRAVPTNIPPCPFPVSAQDVEEYLVEDECRYIKCKGYGQVLKMKQIFKKKLKREFRQKI